MSAHTPAPWFVDDRTIYHKSFGTIATVWPCEYPAGGDEVANARLIASAPDLLEALQYVMSAHGEQLTDAFEQAHKAIARATGAPQ